MKKIVNAAIVACGIALAGAGISAQTAQAEPRYLPGTTVMTIVSWSGADCIPIRTSWGQRQLCDSVQQPAGEAVVEHNKHAGDLVGVDPMMGDADWISCQVFLNGSPQMGYSATAGDGTDANCLRVL
jgi:hypothetical protein